MTSTPTLSDYASAFGRLPCRSAPTRDGVVCWRENGHGPALVLLHGISSGAASWVEQLTGLAQDFRIIAWDAPGYGDSTALPMPSPLASDYARVLEDLVDALQLESCVLVGHSLGALMAAAFAHANPARVRQLILMSPARGYALAPREEREGRYQRRMAQLAQLGPEGLARERAGALVSSSASPAAVDWIGWNMRRLHPAAYTQAARMLANDDIGRYAQGYIGPVAVVSGDADQITPVERCRLVASQFEAGTYQCLAGPGHALYLEDPMRTNAFLRQQAHAAANALQYKEHTS